MTYAEVVWSEAIDEDYEEGPIDNTVTRYPQFELRKTETKDATYVTIE